jgi:hypothetical protein
VARRSQQDLRLDQCDTVRELGRGQAPVLASDNRADPGRGQEQLQIFQAVLGQDRDPHALSDTATL